jgi:hypothetical protein
MTRREVFNECKRISSLAPENRSQAETIITHALLVVSNPLAPIDNRECLLLNRAINCIAEGKYYQACLIVGDAMTPATIRPAMPDPTRSPDFEVLSVAELRLRFDTAIEAPR